VLALNSFLHVQISRMLFRNRRGAYSALPAADATPSKSCLALKSDVRTCTATFVAAFMLGKHSNKGIDQKLARSWRIPERATTDDLAAPVMRPIGPIS
jgi:hypothetical protein